MLKKRLKKTKKGQKKVKKNIFNFFMYKIL